MITDKYLKQSIPTLEARWPGSKGQPETSTGGYENSEMYKYATAEKVVPDFGDSEPAPCLLCTVQSTSHVAALWIPKGLCSARSP
jgi:hypothetical protein